jgi:hypothetical protein
MGMLAFSLVMQGDFDERYRNCQPAIGLNFGKLAVKDNEAAASDKFNYKLNIYELAIGRTLQISTKLVSRQFQ